MQLVTAVTTELALLANGQFFIQHDTEVSNRSKGGTVRDLCVMLDEELAISQQCQLSRDCCYQLH